MNTYLQKYLVIALFAPLACCIPLVPPYAEFPTYEHKHVSMGGQKASNKKIYLDLKIEAEGVNKGIVGSRDKDNNFKQTYVPLPVPMFTPGFKAALHKNTQTDIKTNSAVGEWVGLAAEADVVLTIQVKIIGEYKANTMVFFVREGKPEPSEEEILNGFNKSRGKNLKAYQGNLQLTATCKVTAKSAIGSTLYEKQHQVSKVQEYPAKRRFVMAAGSSESMDLSPLSKAVAGTLHELMNRTLSSIHQELNPALARSSRSALRSAKRFNLVIMPIQLVGKLHGSITSLVDMLLRSQTLSFKAINVVAKADQQTVMKGINESYKQCYDQKCQIEMGRLLSASHMMTSKVFKLGKECSVRISIIDLEKYAIIHARTATCGCDKTSIGESLEKNVKLLLGDFTAGSKDE